MQICIASDHGGYELKKVFVEYLTNQGYQVQDFGPDHLDTTDDYPVFVIPALQTVQKDASLRGIVICRNGVGVSMLANRMHNIRCALSWDPKHVQTAREDDNVNVLALPADYISGETAKEIVDTFLNTKFSEADRHTRRLEALEDNLA